MGNPFKLGEAARGALLASGIYPSVAGTEAPLWFDAENVLFREGGVEKAKKREVLFSAAGNVTALAQAKIGNESRVYHTTNSTVNFWNGTSSTEIGSGFTSGKFILVPWGSWLIATNGTDTLKLWKNIGTLATISGLPFLTAKTAFKIGPFLVCAGLNTSGKSFAWCDENDPENWVVDETTAAGDLLINEFNTDITCAVMVGDSALVFSESHMAIVRYIGGVGVIGYKHYPLGGAIGKYSAVAADGKAFVFQRHSVYVTTGGNKQDIDLGIIREWIQENVDFSDPDAIVGYADNVLGHVAWSVPLKTGGRKTLVFDYNTSAWSKLSQGPSAADGQSIYAQALQAEGSTVYLTSAGEDTTTPWTLTSKMLDFGYQTNWKWLDTIRMVKSGSMQVEVKAYEYANDAPSITTTTFAEAGPQNHLGGVEAVYTQLVFSGTNDFRLSELQVIGQVGSYAQ